MFFTVTQDQLKKQWPETVSDTVLNYTLHLDLGWHRHKDTFFKGYSIPVALQQKVENRDFSETTGCYTILDFSTGECSYYTDDSRGFPLYYNSDTISNQKRNHLTAVWFDGELKRSNKSWQFVKRQDRFFEYDQSNKTISKQQLVDIVCEILVDHAKNLNTDLPLFCSNSPGVDSNMVRSAFDYCNKSYTLVEKNERHAFSALGWGYEQIYVTDQPHVQLTGFCGDELLLRNPMYCQWLMDPHNIDLTDEFDKLDYSYMKGFFNAKYRDKIASRREKFTTKESAFNHTINVAINDFQMWHIDKTITLTPLRNRIIAEKALHADADTILDQVIHAGVSKDIIKRLNPTLLSRISKHKNNVIC